jgi:hypothetical protein
VIVDGLDCPFDFAWPKCDPRQREGVMGVGTMPLASARKLPFYEKLIYTIHITVWSLKAD